MKRTFNIVLLILIVCLTGCREDPILAPEAIINSSQIHGKTTDVFSFSASSSVNHNKNSQLFYSWNFGLENQWNTLPSKDPGVTYRYRVPGDYKIRLLVINSEGLKDSTDLDIHVELGQSNPIADFQINPEKGHIFTDFIFDATESRDDEDSLGNLLFRWDFQSDGLWETDFSHSPLTSHQFSQQNLYKVLLEVQDPSGLKTQLSKDLKVGLTDYDLLVDFNWTPENGTDEDTIRFDASACHHPDIDFRNLTFSWLLEEGLNWTEPVPNPVIYHKFRTSLTQTVRLKVYESRGLSNTTSKEIYLSRANRPPHAHFILSIPRGNVQTQFFVSAWTSLDDLDIPSELQTRWDFEGDGVWDTQFSYEKTIFHQYGEAGEYQLTLEIKDKGGLVDHYSELVTVSPYSNETGMVTDGRDGEIYGTVKIGNQWWFAENLRYEVQKKMYKDDTGFAHFAPWEPWKCLEEYAPYCDLYGKFYHISSVIDNLHDLTPREVNYTLCPRGWRLPAEQDLRELLRTVGTAQANERLTLGGDTDFNLQYLGYMDWRITWSSSLTPEDTIYSSKETYKEAWLFSADEAPNPFRTDIYTIKLFRSGKDLWEGYINTRYFVPVRCIKED